MRAAVLYGKQQIQIEDVPERPLHPGEVRLRVEAALTCGTDLKVYQRGYHARMIVPPAVFGHEVSGVISAVGEGVKGWTVGERVVAANSAPCDACFFCAQRQEHLCDDLLFLNGAYAESITVPSRLVSKNLLRLKPEVSFADAALVEPLACVIKGVEDCALRAGQRVLVLGTGPIGLMFVRLATHLGCEVWVAGRTARRLEAARRLGAREAVDLTGQADPVKAIRAATNAVFDVVIEAVGKPEAWEAAVHLVRKGGTVNFFGGCPAGARVSFDTGRLHYSNLTLLASFHHTPRTVRRALELVEAGLIHAGDFVDGECPLSRLPELFHSMTLRNHAVKTLIRVRE